MKITKIGWIMGFIILLIVALSLVPSCQEEQYQPVPPVDTLVIDSPFIDSAIVPADTVPVDSLRDTLEISK